jgi:CTP synthase (UTP-ammonia lyase)
MVRQMGDRMSKVRIGIIGDYRPTHDTHQATEAALHHAADRLACAVDLTWLPTASLDPLPSAYLESFDALWCAPGSPYQNMDGALNAIRWAREHDRPLLGTCAGFQHIVIEYARTVLGIVDAQHAEYGRTSAPLVVTPLSCSLVQGENLEILVDPESRAGRIYQQRWVREQFRCTFGLNQAYQAVLHDAGLRVVGVDQDGEPRIVEAPAHRFLVGTLFIPQLKSTAEHPHPLIVAYLEEARRVQEQSSLAPPHSPQV